MGVRIAYDPVDDVAVFFDSVSGFALGPIFEHDGGTERAEAFSESLELDMRAYTEVELRDLLREWKAANPHPEDDDE